MRTPQSSRESRVWPNVLGATVPVLTVTALCIVGGNYLSDSHNKRNQRDAVRLAASDGFAITPGSLDINTNNLYKGTVDLRLPGCVIPEVDVDVHRPDGSRITDISDYRLTHVTPPSAEGTGRRPDVSITVQNSADLQSFLGQRACALIADASTS